MPVKSKDIEGQDPWEKAKKKKKLDCNWLAEIISDTGDKKKKDGIRLKSAGLYAKIDGLLTDRIEGSITLEDKLRAIHEKRDKED